MSDSGPLSRYISVHVFSLAQTWENGADQRSFHWSQIIQQDIWFQPSTLRLIVSNLMPLRTLYTPSPIARALHQVFLSAKFPSLYVSVCILLSSWYTQSFYVEVFPFWKACCQEGSKLLNYMMGLFLSVHLNRVLRKLVNGRQQNLKTKLKGDITPQ